MVVAAAGHTEEFAPGVGGESAEGVQRAVDDNGGGAGAVGGGDFLDVGEVGGVGEALVVDDVTVSFGPGRIDIESDLAAGGGAALVNDGPRDVAEFLEAPGERLGLEGVVVAAAAGDEEGADGCGRLADGEEL